MAKSPTKEAWSVLEQNEVDAEDALLLGDFRRALKLANECLLQAETVGAPSSSAEDTLVLHTPLHLFSNVSVLDNSDVHHLCVHFSHSKDPLERFVAVALQSWYELYSRCDKQRPVLLRQGVRNLEPLLSLYTTTNEKNGGTTERRQRSMSMELVWLFLQFCRATNHHAFAINAALEVLHHALYHGPLQQNKLGGDDDDDIDTWQQAALAEMLQVLLQEWIVCAPKHQVVKALQLLFASSREWAMPDNSHVIKWNRTDEIQLDSARYVVRVLNEDGTIDRLPSWATETLRQCNIYLQSTLLLDDSDNKAAAMNAAQTDLSSPWNIDATASLNDTNSTNEDQLALSLSKQPRRISKSVQWLIGYIKSKAKEVIRTYRSTEEESCAQQNHHRLAVAVMALCAAWFHRRRVKRIMELMSRLLIKATFMKPVMEIVHAIIPSDSH